MKSSTKDQAKGKVDKINGSGKDRPDQEGQ